MRTVVPAALLPVLVAVCARPRPVSLDAATTSSAPDTTTQRAAGLPLRYLALGDSFTIGTGSEPEKSFPARLAARCRSAVSVRNIAVNGYSTQDIVDLELPEVPRFAPHLVTLAAGANDIVRGVSPDEYRARLRVIFRALHAAGVARVVTLPQPDWSLSPAAQAFGDPGALHARIVGANAILREETAIAGGTYVDLFPLMESQARAGMIAQDGLHPSAEAYDAWADALARQGVTP
jgi:acyl-CoA thioesterase-1